MDKVQKKYINKNVVKLIDCTKDINKLATHLISNEFLSLNTWQILKKENPDEFSLIREVYMQCMKTPDYDLLIECLEETDNGNAAEILKKINVAVKDSSQKSQSQPSTSDFTVSEKGIANIVDLLKQNNLLGNQWAEVQKHILSPSALNAITEESNFGIRVLKDLKEWRDFQKEKATFNKLHAIINEIHPEAAGILMAAKNDIMNST